MLNRTPILRRGTELFYLGIYPVVLTADVPIPFDEHRQDIELPCTSIIAFGSEDEGEYSLTYKVRELMFKYTPNFNEIAIWNRKTE